MKIVADDFADSIERPELVRADGALAVPVLENAFDDQTWRADDERAMFAEKVRLHDRLRDPCFIFQREEDESLRRSGPLPHDDRAGRRDAFSVRQLLELHRRMDAVAFQLWTEMREQVRASRQIGRCVTGERLAASRHFAKW